MNIIRLSCCALLVAFVWVVGCSAPKPAPDPLAGWKLVYLSEPDKAIVEDYQSYIQNLPTSERKFVGPIFFFEDGTSQHAIRFEIALDGIDWAHVLIYDRDDKRIKVIKYMSGHYRS